MLHQSDHCTDELNKKDVEQVKQLGFDSEQDTGDQEGSAEDTVKDTEVDNE